MREELMSSRVRQGEPPSRSRPRRIARLNAMPAANERLNFRLPFLSFVYFGKRPDINRCNFQTVEFRSDRFCTVYERRHMVSEPMDLPVKGRISRTVTVRSSPSAGRSVTSRTPFPARPSLPLSQAETQCSHSFFLSWPRQPPSC